MPKLIAAIENMLQILLYCNYNAKVQWTIKMEKVGICF